MKNSQLKEKLETIEQHLINIESKLDDSRKRDATSAILTVSLALLGLGVTYALQRDTITTMFLAILFALVVMQLIPRERKQLQHAAWFALIIAGISFAGTGIALNFLGVKSVTVVGIILFALSILSVFALTIYQPNTPELFFAKVARVWHAFRLWICNGDHERRIEKKDFISFVPIGYVTGMIVYQQGFINSNSVTMGLGWFMLALAILSMYASLGPVPGVIREYLYIGTSILSGLSILIYIGDLARGITDLLNTEVNRFVIHAFNISGLVIIVGMYIYHFRNIALLGRQKRRDKKARRSNQ